MPRPKTNVLTEAEQRIMRVLWSRGEATVREVADEIGRTRATAYNTILTLLKILDDKGYVTPRQEGRAFVYRPLVSRAEARTQALRQVLGQFFDGSPTALAQHLLRSEEIDFEELAALRLELDQEASDD